MNLSERGVWVVLTLGALTTAFLIYFLHQYPLAVSLSVIPAFLSVAVADTKYQPRRKK